MAYNKGHENLKPIKPGEVRNPMGKKKGTKNIRTLIREAMENAPQHELDKIASKRGVRVGTNAEELIYTVQVLKAAEGDPRSIQFLAEYQFGKPLQRIEQTGPTEYNINIRTADDGKSTTTPED